MNKILVAVIAFFTISANAEFNYLSKTVTAEGYISEYKIITGSGEDSELFGTHFALAATKADAQVASDLGLSIKGSVFVQHCDRDEFSAAGYTIPSKASVRANVDILQEASENNRKVNLTYWDNGNPLSGKCIIRLEVQ